MKTKDVIILGKGGHAKSVINIIEEQNEFNIVGITAVSFEEGEQYMGYPVLGNDNVLADYIEKGVKNVALGVGGFKDNLLRKKIFNKIKSMGFSFPPIVHPSASVSQRAKIGEGTIIKRGAVVDTDVRVGVNCILEIGSVVGHDTTIGDHTLISGGATVGANTTINENVVCALSATVISAVEVGPNILVGAGAVVVNNVFEEGVYLGCPAKLVKRS